MSKTPLENLQSEYKKLAERHEELRQENIGLKARIKELEAQLEQKDAEITGYRSGIRVAQQDIAELQTGLSAILEWKAGVVTDEDMKWAEKVISENPDMLSTPPTQGGE